MRTFDFDSEFPTKPAWMAWDATLARGECLRCGDALSASDGESSDQALSRHVYKHRECAPDEADRRKQKQEREDIVRRLKASRLVAAPSGLALQSVAVAAGMRAQWKLAQSLAPILLDESVYKVEHPVIREGIACVLDTLSKVNDLLQENGYQANGDNGTLDRIAYQVGYQAQSQGLRSPSEIERAKVEFEQQATERRLELQKAELEYSIKAQAADKLIAMLPSMLPALSEKLANLGQVDNRPKYALPFQEGIAEIEIGVSGTRLLGYSSRTVIGEVVDLYIGINESIDIDVYIEFDDIRQYEGSIKVLREYKGAVFRKRKLRLCPGMPIYVRFGENRTTKNISITGCSIVLAQIDAKTPLYPDEFYG